MDVGILIDVGEGLYGSNPSEGARDGPYLKEEGDGGAT